MVASLDILCCLNLGLLLDLYRGTGGWLEAASAKLAFSPITVISFNAVSFKIHQWRSEEKAAHLESICTLNDYLPSVQQYIIITLHHKHVDKMDEDAWSQIRVCSRIRQPLVNDHKHKVSEKRDHEDQLRNKYQVDAADILKVPATHKNTKISQTHEHTSPQKPQRWASNRTSVC